MKTTDKRIDAYIAKAPEFAVPILEKVRRVFHKASPKIGETMKWSTPHFEYEGLIGGMAAFKKHVSVTLWKGKLLSDPEGLFSEIGKTSMASLKVASVKELPSEKVFVAYIKEAMRLNEEDVKLPTVANGKKKRATLKVPDDLAAALKTNKKAKATFDGFSYTNRMEYIEWITDAKREATRAKRLATTIEWLSEGKSRNWKYQNC